MEALIKMINEEANTESILKAFKKSFNMRIICLAPSYFDIIIISY